MATLVAALRTPRSSAKEIRRLLNDTSADRYTLPVVEKALAAALRADQALYVELVGVLASSVGEKRVRRIVGSRLSPVWQRFLLDRTVRSVVRPPVVCVTR